MSVAITRSPLRNKMRRLTGRRNSKNILRSTGQSQYKIIIIWKSPLSNRISCHTHLHTALRQRSLWIISMPMKSSSPLIGVPLDLPIWSLDSITSRVLLPIRRNPLTFRWCPWSTVGHLLLSNYLKPQSHSLSKHPCLSLRLRLKNSPDLWVLHKR